MYFQKNERNSKGMSPLCLLLETVFMVILERKGERLVVVWARRGYLKIQPNFFNKKSF